MRTLQVLIVDESVTDTMAIVRELKEAGFHLDFERVDHVDEMRRALRQQSWELILCDYQTPGIRAQEALAALQAEGLDVPLVFLSAPDDRAEIIQLLQAGAQDALSGDEMARLIPAVERELRSALVRAELRRMADHYREGAEQYHRIIDSLHVGVVTVNDGFVTQYVNRGMSDMLGYAVEELVPRPLTDLLLREEVADHTARMDAVMRGEGACCRRKLRRKDGRAVPALLASTSFLDECEMFLGAVFSVTDLSNIE